MCDPPPATVVGILKGYDQLLNLVMDEIEETLHGQLVAVAPLCNSSKYIDSLHSSFCSLRTQTDPETGAITEPPQTRSLGLAVLRGTSLVVLSPIDG